jgi:hypothetical protein
MPNWVTNRLTIGGDNFERVIGEITTENAEGERNFDFNKIVPMPESLHVIAGGTTDKCVALYLTAANPNVEYYGGADDKIPHKEYSEILSKLYAGGVKTTSFDSMLPVEKIAEYESMVIGGDPVFNVGATREDAVAYGKRAADNVLLYGHMNWYDWALANWGVKWNAGYTTIDGNVIEFDTAWADVADLMRRMSEKYPDNTFYYDFAEECAGNYAGEFAFKCGKQIDGGYFDAGSREAYEKYFELWGDADLYQFDERAGTYVTVMDGNGRGGAEM